MSQDLFAAFSSLAVSGQPKNETDGRQVYAPETRHLAPGNGTLIDDGDQNQESTGQTDGDDDFGDFEDASAGLTNVEDPTIAPRSNAPEARTEVVKSQGCGSALVASRDAPPAADTAKSAKPLGTHPFAGHMDLLFSTDDDDEYNAGADEMTDLATNPEAAMAYSKRVIAEQMAGQQTPRSLSAVDKNKQRGHTPGNPSGVTEVLFDMDAMGSGEQPDDSFGDFVAPVSHELQDQTRPPDGKGAISKSILPATHSVPPKNPARKDSQVENLNAEKITNALIDDDWDDFEEAAPSEASAIPAGTTPYPANSSTKAPPSKSTTTAPASSLPPTNIPPPLVLLSVFPSLFAAAQDTLFEPLSKLDAKQRQTLLSHPATQQFLRKYINQAVVLAHIIAGRKLRWKRDQHLNQSMRIGPAAAGGKGGMKLAGIDKSEATKEDREVLDVIRLWRAQIGKLRTAAAGASTAIAVSGLADRLAPVPEISEQMPVKALKALEGGITAPHACALCGLRREERVAKVDVEVEDSFGEWWVEEMQMHLLCRDFWEEQKRRLKSR